MRLESFAVTFCLCLMFLVGCGGDGKYPVSGSVRWDGEPIPDDHTGHVVFTPVDPTITPDAGKIGPGGTFHFRSSPGEKKVEIYIDRPMGKTSQVMNAEVRQPYIPTRYNEQTELQITVGTSGNDFEFALESQPGDKIAGQPN